MKDFAKALVLVAMTGAVAYAVYLTKSGSPLWALIIVLYMASVLYSRENQGF